jgi:hypothetical protein
MKILECIVAGDTLAVLCARSFHLCILHEKDSCGTMMEMDGSMKLECHR